MTAKRTKATVFRAKCNETLTCSRYAVLRVYQEYVKAHGYGPSLAKMIEMTKAHQVTVSRHIRALVQLGYLKPTGIPQLKWEVVRSKLEKVKVDPSRYRTQSDLKSGTLHELGESFAVLDKVIFN
jgi:hypothetical protein